MSDTESQEPAGQEEIPEEVSNQIRIEGLRLSENLMKVTDFVAVKGGKVKAREIKEFRNFAAELGKRDLKSLKKAERDWLSNYLENYDLLDELLIIANSAEEFKETEAKASWANATPPLPLRPDSRSRQHGGYETVVPPDTGASKLKLNELVVKPNYFDGVKPPPRTWLDNYEKAAEANGWSDFLKAKYMNTFLRDTANDWIVTFARRKLGPQPNWYDLRRSFIQHYIGDTDKHQLRRMIATTFQQRDEKSSVFIPKLLRLLLMLEPGRKEEDLVEEIKVKLRGSYQDKLALLEIRDLDALVAACLKVEAGAAASKTSFAREERNKTSTLEWRSKATPKFKENKQETKRKQDKPYSSSKNQNSKSPVKCYRCDKLGHFARDCSKERISQQDFNRKRKGGVNLVAEAESPEVKEDSQPIASIHTARTMGKILSIVEGNGNLIDRVVKCNGIEVEAIVDTGAARSVISSKLAQENGWQAIGCSQLLSHAAGGTLDVKGEVKAEIELSDKGKKSVVQAPLVVVNNLCAPMILGMDILQKLQVTIDTATRRLTFRPDPRKSVSKGVRAVGQTLPGRSVCLVSGRVDTAAQTILCYPFNTDPCIMTASTICQVQAGQVLVQVINLDRAPIRIEEGQQFASFSELVRPEKENLLGAVMQLDGCKEIVKIGDTLTPQQVEDLKNLFTRHRAAFLIDGSIGSTSLTEHTIEIIPGTRPIVEPVRRHPRAHELEADKQVAEMLEKGIIEESKSPWASEYVLVRKKTGEWRMCVDFRRLNSVTKKNCYPLPNAEACVEALAGKNYFSKLDFASGYWQVPVAKTSREFTAFRTAKGLYQFKVMPFGLTNAPASFQKLINALMAGLEGLNLQVYLDDVCIASKSWEEHRKALDEVLHVVVRSGMKLKGSKCEFGLNQVTFLGHLVSELGVQQDPDKLSALTNLPAPNDVSGVRRVLGAMSYYRKFVPNFATLSAPLSRLTCKDVDFNWGQLEQQAFDSLKAALADNATLSWLDSANPIRLKTDASLIGIGGILLQKKEDEWKIVACASRKLSISEKNYCATELEGLAVVYCVVKFRCYLLGRHFTIFTDHCALCALKSRNSKNARLRRWSLILSEYDYDIEYVSGKKHIDADCLSRAPVEPEETYLESKLLALATPVSSDAWLDETDEETKRLRGLADANESGYISRNGLIYYRQRLYVPKDKRLQVIQQSHNESYAGHDGIKGTLSRMANLFWPNMADDVKEYIATCKPCQMRKTERAKPKGVMRSFEATKPLQLVAVDYLGPLQPSREYRHICVAIDGFSKYLVAEPMENKSAANFVQFLRDFVAKFGVPQLLISDNGRQFDDLNCRQIYADLHIQHRQLAAYHHRGNALAERVIQTLQEKLNLFMIEKREDEWHKVLNEAVLCINTKKHSSTRQSPYALMFNRTHTDVQSLICKQSELLTAEQARIMQREANLCNAEHIRRSRQYFERKNERRDYDMEQLVLSKLKDRRLSKLANKYEGPFRVVEKSNDVYGLVNCQSGKKIYRHTSYLKPFNMMANIVLLVITLSLGLVVGAQIILQQASPVYWTEVPDKYVAEGSEYLPFEIYFSSPCSLLTRYDEMLAKYKRNADGPKPMMKHILINNHVGTQLASKPVGLPVQPPIITITNNKVATMPTMPTVPTLPTISTIPTIIGNPLAGTPNRQNAVRGSTVNNQPVIITPEEEEMELDDPLERSNEHGLWLSEKEMNEFKNLTRPKRAILYQGKCEEIYKGALLTTIQKFQYDKRQRHKRFIEFIAGIIFSNVLQSVRDHYFSEKPDTSFEERYSHAQAQLRILNERTDMMALAQRASINTSKQMANAINNINQQIAMQPQLSVLTDYIISEIYSRKQLLERLYYSLEEDKGDLVTLAQLFGSVHFEKLLAQDVEIVTAKSPSIGVLRVGISGRVRSTNTKIYRVNTLSHYRSLESGLIHYDYAGKTLVVYNRSADCTKGIETDSNNYVTATCDVQGWKDETLRIWRKTPIKNITSEVRHSSYTLIWPRSIVYCWGNNITIISKQTVVTECPHYAFYIDSTLSFHTSDGLVEHKGGNNSKPNALADCATEARQSQRPPRRFWTHSRHTSRILNQSILILMKGSANSTDSTKRMKSCDNNHN